MPVCISVACNHPDNGLFDGRAPMITVGAVNGMADYLELECWSRRDRAPRFTETLRGFRLLRREWPVESRKYGVGNWCWNGYLVRHAVAVRFVCWLRETGFYGVDGAEENLHEWWKHGGDFPGFRWKARLTCVRFGRHA